MSVDVELAASIGILCFDKGVNMSQVNAAADDRNVAFRQWQFKETVELEHQRQELKEERRQLEQERYEFEKEKKEFEVNKKMEDKRAEYEKHLFDMKWKILEGELKKLAAEKKQIEKQRDFYRFVTEYGAEGYSSKMVRGEMFFSGVDNEDALKKRYKDLIKIYHPDNLNGDKDTIQEINMEYEKMKSLYE